MAEKQTIRVVIETSKDLESFFFDEQRLGKL